MPVLCSDLQSQTKFGSDLSLALVGMLMSSSKLFNRKKFRHETVIGLVLCYIHQACCHPYIWAKLTVAFTCTSLLLNLYTSVCGCGCGFGFEQKFWRPDQRTWRIKGTDRRICIPRLEYKNHILFVTKIGKISSNRY